MVKCRQKFWIFALAAPVLFGVGTLWSQPTATGPQTQSATLPAAGIKFEPLPPANPDLMKLPEIKAQAEQMAKAGATLLFYQLQAGTPDANGWLTAASASSHLSVELPGKFNDFASEGKATDGVPIVLRSLGCVADEVKYVVALTERADGALPGGLSVREMADSVGKESDVKSNRTLQWEGHACFERVFDDGTKAATMRFIDYGPGRVILQVAEHAPGKGNPKNIERFMNSLKIVPAKASM